jgi:GntR family transcriptional repressor for pyruvate dehydrogenase complex
MESVKPVSRASLAEQIAENLRRQILSGALKPGENLPPERKLSKQFGTNRNTLREAIRTLEGLKLVTVRQGAGVRVRDFRTEGEAAILPYFFVEGGSLEERTLALSDLLTLRRLILSEAASLAAQRALAPDLSVIADHIHALERVESDEELAELDLELYRLLVSASHSLTLLWMFNTFYDVYRKALPVIRGIWVTPPNYLSSLRKFLKALKNRNAGSASKIIRAHLSRGDAIVLKNLSKP